MSKEYPLHQRHPQLSHLITWLKKHEINISDTVEEILRRLRKEGRYLRPQSRDKYVRKVILGQFLYHWVSEHQATDWNTLREQPTLKQDMDLYETAILLALDSAVFTRYLKSFTRAGLLTVDGLRPKAITSEEFSGYVTSCSAHIGRKVFENFDPGRQSSSASILRYLAKTAVSRFLERLNASGTVDRGWLLKYLDRPRVSQRTKLAAKLCYFPYAITLEEKKSLQKKYGWEVNAGRIYKIKEVAGRLGYGTADALYQKLYKVRERAKRHAS